MLINNLNEVKNVMQISAAISFERLQPLIANAESKYTASLLGRAMHQALTEFCNDPDKHKFNKPGSQNVKPDHLSESEYWNAVLLWYAQHAIVHLAYCDGFNVINAYISDKGFSRIESDTTKSLFKYQEDNLKDYFQDNGMNSLDTMLNILETNIEYFEPFKPELQKLKGRIIPNTQTFNSHYHIGNSRLIFLRLQPHIKAVEELILTPAIGKEQMSFILSELQKSEPAEKVKPLLPYIRDPLAYFAAAMLMEDSGAEISERGLYFTATEFQAPADPARVSTNVSRTRAVGDQYLNRLNRFMQNHWPGHEPIKRRTHNRDNAGKKTFWV